MTSVGPLAAIKALASSVAATMLLHAVCITIEPYLRFSLGGAAVVRHFRNPLGDQLHGLQAIFGHFRNFGKQIETSLTRVSICRPLRYYSSRCFFPGNALSRLLLVGREAGARASTA